MAPWNAFHDSSGRALAVCHADVRDEHRWFADEVVIDFPSVAPAVDRMRRAFLADERITPMSADVQLSPREAHDGATVPLQVPVQCTCHQCFGRGGTWAQSCAWCAGAGVEVLRHNVHVRVPAGVEDGARFHFSIAARYDLSTRIELRVLVG